MKKLLPILLTLLIGMASHAQNYPIYVSASLTPPYTLRLSDYSKVGSQALVVTVQVRDMSVSNLPVKLSIKLETSGVTIETPVSIPAPPISLSGGQVSMLFGEDLSAYFTPENLTWKGYSLEQYRRAGQLPEGFYRLSVQVLHYSTGRPISNVGSATAWIAWGKPPILKDPQDGVEVGQVSSMPLVFSWGNSQVGVPQGNVQYTLQLWELRMQGVDPYIISASQPPFYTHAPQATTTAMLNPAALMLEPGMRYAWRVTAADATGLIPFEQSGQSEVRAFTYLAKCDSVRDFKTNLAPNRSATIQWKAGTRHLSYNVEVENPESGWQNASQSFNTQVQYFDLTQGSTYRVRVQSVCNDPLQTTGDFTAWRTLKVPPPKPPDTAAACPECRCDNAGAIRGITNLELRHDLKPGDTLTDKRGTTRYIIRTAEQQAPGVYRGVFLFWAELWKFKIVCTYQDLSVNTDNVILRMSYQSVYDPKYLLDVDKVTDYINKVAGAVDELTTNKTVRDTLRYAGPIESIYGKGDSLFIVTKNPDGTLTETLLQPDQKLNATLVQGSNGEEYVVTGSGQAMGVEEFKATGGSARQVEELKKEKEKAAATACSVQFVATSGQKYGFDSYAEATKTALQNEYPELRPGYRPAYKSMASFATDKVTTTGGTATTTYKDEMGLPAVKNGDTELTLRGGATGTETALYAYHKTDSAEQIVGKLNLLSYDEQHKKLYLVSVNGAKLPSEKALQAELNKIYAPSITKWNVVKANAISVNFTGEQMMHGGSGLIDVYNADQKKVINSFGKLDKNTLYLFFVENVKGKDGDIAGYMPLQYQCGFIYDNPNPSIIAHELGHGAFNLRHTFSNERFIAAQGKTLNLMDYAGGTELWKHQWGEIQDPQKMWLAFLEDESESEWTTDGHFYTVQLVALLMNLDATLAKKLGEAAENPDSHVHGDGSMQEKTTWAKAKLQQRFHALTGGYHGVELAATTYAMLKTRKDDQSLYYLLHRFGDCFAHFEMEQDAKGWTFVPLQDYYNAFEQYINHFINDNISIVSSISIKDINSKLQSDCGNYFYVKEQRKFLTSQPKEKIAKDFTDFVLAGIHGSHFIEVFFPDGPNSDEITLLSWEEAQKQILSILPKAVQNDNQMYGDLQVSCGTLGHALIGSNPDNILQRQLVYLSYIEQLVDLLQLYTKHTTSSDKKQEIVKIFNALLVVLEYFPKDARLDAILAFEIGKLKYPNSDSLFVIIPIKSFNKKDVNIILRLYYKFGPGVKSKGSFRLLKNEAHTIYELFERYVNTANAYYTIESVDDSSDEQIVIKLKKMAPIS